MMSHTFPLQKKVLSFLYRHWILSVCISGLILALFIAWYFLIGPSRGLAGKDFDSSNNAVWIEHAWADQEKSISDISKLVSALGDNHMRYAFVHVGPIESDGKIPTERFKMAKRFLDIARIYTDRMEFQAWIGQIRSKLDLKNPLVRKNIVDTAKFLVNDVGFQGVHLDIEPVWDGDEDFLSLLREMRATLGKNVKITVALSELIPGFVVNSFSPFMHLKNYNTETYYRKVLDTADGVAVMTYESGIQTPWVYTYFVKQQVIWTTRLLHGKEKKIWIGLPSYDKGVSIYPKAENLETGLQGVIDGLNNTRSNAAGFLGISVYPYWETSDEEWQTYQKMWLGK